MEGFARKQVDSIILSLGLFQKLSWGEDTFFVLWGRMFVVNVSKGWGGGVTCPGGGQGVFDP